MTAKQQAILDIKEDLERQNKCFLAFRSELDSVMGKLVREQLHAQYRPRQRQKTQLIAHCLFSHSSVNYNNYEKYYG